MLYNNKGLKLFKINKLSCQLVLVENVFRTKSVSWKIYIINALKLRNIDEFDSNITLHICK